MRLRVGHDTRRTHTGSQDFLLAQRIVGGCRTSYYSALAQQAADGWGLTFAPAFYAFIIIFKQSQKLFNFINGLTRNTKVSLVGHFVPPAVRSVHCAQCEEECLKCVW